MDFLNSFVKIAVSSALIIAAFGYAEASPTSSNEMTIATFNVKWFGLGGAMSGSPAKEKRDATLKKFINQEVMPADLIVFEEVVDVPRLQKLLPTSWKCQSYDNPTPTHQHVATCISEKYKFGLVDYDDNNTIETVAINGDKSRPAVRLNVMTLQNRTLFTLVGVHLKAYPEESKTRQYQAGEIAKDLEALGSQTPVLITGDFNTYSSSQNGESEDDSDLILENLNQLGAGFTHVTPVEQYTYRSGGHKSQFDHFYLRGGIKAQRGPDVFDVCNSAGNGQEFMNISYYNKNVSDHCPVKLTVTIGR